MSQSVIPLQGASTVAFPAPTGNNISLNGLWTGTQIGSSNYTLLTSVASNGNAIQALIQGYAQLDNGAAIYYNIPANFGGQTTPSAAWLSPAQDDSWAPNYQAAGLYQATTQVPTQQAPYMTHVYHVSGSGIFMCRIAYVIDDDNFVVYDPNGLAVLVEIGVGYLCENFNPATSMKIDIESGVSLVIATEDTFYGPQTINGPTTLEFTANKFGVVPPIAIDNGSAGANTMVIINR